MSEFYDRLETRRPATRERAQMKALREAVEGLAATRAWKRDRKSTRLNSSHNSESRMPSSA
jgi:ribosomal protein S12 methylthiotransferase accessory factor YcaO